MTDQEEQKEVNAEEIDGMYVVFSGKNLDELYSVMKRLAEEHCGEEDKPIVGMAKIEKSNGKESRRTLFILDKDFGDTLITKSRDNTLPFGISKYKIFPRQLRYMDDGNLFIRRPENINDAEKMIKMLEELMNNFVTFKILEKDSFSVVQSRVSRQTSHELPNGFFVIFASEVTSSVKAAVKAFISDNYWYYISKDENESIICKWKIKR